MLKVSVSSLDTYESCPRKYKFQQIDKLPRKSFEHLDVGNYVHEVLEHFHKELNADSTQQPEALLKSLAKKIWDKYSFKISPEGMEKSKGLLKSYLTYVSEKGWPTVLATEDRFSIEINSDILIRGVVDRIDKTEKGFAITDYKGLALDTPLPTPSGWTTMGEISVGDEIFGSNGRPTKVTVKSGIHNRDCYKLTMSDGSSVVCDNVHLWSVAKEMPFRVVRRLLPSDESVMSADELFNVFKKGDSGWHIRNPAPLKTSNIADFDAEVAFLETELSPESGIATKWLRAGQEQREELYRRFAESGSHNSLCAQNVGQWSSLSSPTRFVLHSEKLLGDLGELARSLGLSVSVVQHWSASTQEASQEKLWVLYCSKSESGYKQIANIEKVDSVPTQCIAVDAPDHLFVCGKEFNLTHNTGQSKYLDKFQLQVYGMHLKKMYPDVENYEGIYIVLPEGPKALTYNITMDDVEAAKQDVIKTATDIATDKTWDPKPTFLCKFCDFNELCPDAWGKKTDTGLVKVGRSSF